jgi:hypothetical protein
MLWYCVKTACHCCIVAILIMTCVLLYQVYLSFLALYIIRLSEGIVMFPIARLFFLSWMALNLRVWSTWKHAQYLRLVYYNALQLSGVPVVPVYFTEQFSRWRPFNEWLVRSQTISSFVKEFYHVFLWILDLSYSTFSWKLTWCFFRATSLEMRYLYR